MNKRILTAVVISATLAMLGLLFMQGLWIRNGIQVREENFRRAVSDAARQVIHDLERIEAIEMLSGGPDDGRGISELREMDSLRRAFSEHLAAHPEVFREKGRKHRQRGPEQTSPGEGQSAEYGPASLPAAEAPDQRPETSSAPDSVQDAIIHAYVGQKSKLLERALRTMLTSGGTPSERQLRQGLIDTLLTSALHARGISAEYVFGVFNPLRNEFTVMNDTSQTLVLLNKGMVFTLFPSDMVANPDLLILHFPGKNAFLLHALWGPVGISATLILVLILAFVYSILTVMRQRRFAEMKNDFINNMTHEFKTPISTVALACEALSDKDIEKSDGLYTSYIGIISEENKRLGTMAEKILQTAIIDKGELKLKLEEMDLHAVISEVIHNIRIQVEIKDGSITPDFRAASGKVTADKVHMANVVYNLLDNANKYTPKRPGIIVRTRDVPSGIMVHVIDNGIGINRSDHRKVFERLYRVPTGDLHDFKGFGLGLSYVKAIVEGHGGKVGVESEPGKGSDFWFTIPLG